MLFEINLDNPGTSNEEHESETTSDNLSDDLIEVEDEVKVHEMREIEEGDSLQLKERNESGVEPQIRMSCVEAKRTAIPKQKIITGSQQYGNNRQQKSQRRKYIPFNLEKELHSTEYMRKEDALNINDVWELEEGKQRWMLYRYWIKEYTNYYMRMKAKLDEDYRSAFRRHQEILNQEDRSVLQSAKVIGMTTTGAAKYHSLLQEIKPAVMMVEEAAEIFEAHIITALTNKCQHLILIGDHQQLRPNPTVYKLAKEFNLEVSLFERLVRRGIPYKALSNQHRMRPEICQYIRGIYPAIQNDDVVLEYNNVKGIKHNIFFIDHKVPEACHNKETTTHANDHEASFVAELCRYLIKQGYEHSQITILAAYSGQLHLIQQKMVPQQEFADVRITSIDNFQGEENNIILLSLVRSNKEEQIGFLKVENRISVAMSRAKEGFYCIGNFDQLALSSDRWSEIQGDARKNNAIGESLPLVCQRHEHSVTNVSRSTDFERVPLGGCGKPCEAKLRCGHACGKLCHPLDTKHLLSICQHPCEKIICSSGHACPRRCGEICAEDCEKNVDKVLPECGHTQSVPCFQDVAEMRCQYPCRVNLHCGHVNMVVCCKKDDEIKCKELVTETLDCGHTENRECHIPKSAFACPHRCQEKLNCGHQCQGTCSTCKMGHRPCTEKCLKRLFCTHPCERDCSEACLPCPHWCNQYCKDHKWYCNKLCNRPCVPCKKSCNWKCPHARCSRACGQICDRRPCNEPCHRKLPNCNHKCMGLCGESCICKCLLKDEQKSDIMSFASNNVSKFVKLDDCGHVYEVGFLDSYMAASTDNSSQPNLVQHIPCPWPTCGIPIWNCRRYGGITKKIMLELNTLKSQMMTALRTQIECKVTMEKDINTLQEDISLHKASDEALESFMDKWFLKHLKEIIQKPLRPKEMVHRYNQLHTFKFARVLETAVIDRATNKHTPICEEALDGVNMSLVNIKDKARKNSIDTANLMSIFEECHTIRLLLELEAAGNRACQKERQKLIERYSIPDEQARMICCASDDVIHIYDKLEHIIWQLTTTPNYSGRHTDIQEQLDSIVLEHFCSVTDRIQGRDFQLRSTTDVVSGRWLNCKIGHTFPEYELKKHVLPHV